MPRRAPSLAGVVFALLVIATLAAFAWSQRLKRDPLVLDHVTFAPVPRRHRHAPTVRSFTPNGDCRYDRERIRFRVTKSDRADVQVVKPGGGLVVTLARDRFLKRYHYFTFHWDGRSREGGTAPPGRYKLRVKLLSQERTLVPPGVIRLHRVPPNPPPGCRGKRKARR
ncbi:MAG: hypothetical protein ACHQCF_04275 [Solirubrobacterales bacterium]